MYDTETKEHLITEAQKGNREAMGELLSDNTKLIQKICWGYTPTTLMDYDDMFQEGAMGFMEAVRRYEPDKGALSTYATSWIRKYISYAMHQKGLPIRVPQNTYIKVRQCVKACSEAEAVSGNKPDMGTLSRELGVGKEKAEELYKLSETVLSSCVSLDSEDRAGVPVKDSITDGDSMNGYSKVENSMLGKEITEKVKRMVNEREWEYISRRFGLCGIPCETYEDMGKKANISKQAVNNAVNRGLAKLKRDPWFKECMEAMAS